MVCPGRPGAAPQALVPLEESPFEASKGSAQPKTDRYNPNRQETCRQEARAFMSQYPSTMQGKQDDTLNSRYW